MDPRNMMPPVPMHLPHQFPNEPPQVVPHHQGYPQESIPSGVRPMGQPIGDEGLINPMEKLHLDGYAAGKTTVVVDQDNTSKYLPPLDGNAHSPLYEKWKICLEEPGNGQKPNCTCTQLPDTSAALEKKFRDTKKTSATYLYQVPGRLRAEVDDLIRDCEREDPRFQWTCESAKARKYWKKEASRAVKIAEVTIVIMRKLRPEFSSKSASSSSSSSIRSPFTKDVNGTLDPESKGNLETPGMGAQFGRGPVQGAFPASMATASQHQQGQNSQSQYPQYSQTQYPQSQYPQSQHPQGQHPQNQHPQNQHPQSQYPQSQHPLHRSGQEYMMGGQRPMMGAMPPQQKAHFGGQPAMTPDYMGAAGPKASVGVEALGEKKPLHPRGAAVYASAQSPGNPNMRFPAWLDESAQKPRKPQANMSAPKILHEDLRSSKSPKIPPAPEPWTPDSSSVEDDDSIRFPEDEDSSATEDPPEENFERSQHLRGSLHCQRRHSKPRKDEPSYRAHYRKQPRKTSEDGRQRYSTGFIDVIPGSSLRAHREPGRARHYYSIQRAPPRVIQYGLRDLHDPIPGVDDLAYLEKLREQRLEKEYERQRQHERVVQNHILQNRLREEAEESLRRCELLQERKEYLRRQERALAYRVKEHEARLLNRRLSLHEPPPLRRDLNYDYLVRDDLDLLY
ncbi:hypothetical protein VTN77DRAFT_1321 [Rasamsonia byssochlamydoides]|uniref:uncharacterized protein n=1 Tax=Rasamsonia byssochlamydoides TaxID=89139 RepID=UPI003742D8FD